MNRLKGDDLVNQMEIREKIVRAINAVITATTANAFIGIDSSIEKLHSILYINTLSYKFQKRSTFNTDRLNECRNIATV